MAYSTVSDVKYVLGLSQTELSFDTELAKWIETADGHIDDALTKYVLVPLVVVPVQIKWLSAMFAAAHFREARDESRASGGYLRLVADGYLRTYVLNRYVQGKMTEIPADLTVGLTT